MEIMLDASKYRALNDIEVVHPDKAYPLSEYLSDVQNGMWRELDSPAPAIHPMRRALQREYLDILDIQMMAFKNDMAVTPGDGMFYDSNAAARGTDIRAVGRANLRYLLNNIRIAIPKAADAMQSQFFFQQRDKHAAV